MAEGKFAEYVRELLRSKGSSQKGWQCVTESVRVRFWGRAVQTTVKNYWKGRVVPTETFRDAIGAKAILTENVRELLGREGNSE